VPPAPILRTARLVLRPPRLTDAPAIFARYACDPEVTRYLRFRPHPSADTTAAFLQATLAACERGDELCWALCESHDDAPAGMITLRLADTRAELGYVLARRYWGHGYMVEAAREVIAHALDALGMHRVEALCDAANAPSIRVLDKLMTREGLLHRYGVHPNVSSEPRDVYVYARWR